MTKNLFILTLISLYSLLLPAQVAVRQKLERTDIFIGEQVNLRVSVTAGRKAHIEFPKMADTLVHGVEVLDMTGVDTVQGENNRIIVSRDYLLTSFDSALYELPALGVLVDGKLYHAENSIGLKVSTVPVDTVNLDKASGPHGPVSLSFRWNKTLTWSSLLLWALFFAIMALLLRIKSHKPITRKVTIYPPKPAHEAALARIARIKETAETASPDILRKCFDELTEVLKAYLQERFGFETAQLTSGEIIRRLSDIDNAEALRELREVLTTADLVKFADMAASQSDTFRNLNEIGVFVSQTRLPDEALPRPEVREVLVGDKIGRLIRRLAIAFTVILVVAEAILLVCLCYVVYDCFA
ncbi:MAG: hypothetical protein J1F06_01350 [Prevotellaceae bacterium]|nr:hypothetical protein [Prevotellaceae bacterium]